MLPNIRARRSRMGYSKFDINHPLAKHVDEGSHQDFSIVQSK